MSYGLNIYKSDVTLGFSTLDITWMPIDQFEVAANGTVSNNYPIATGMTISTQIQMVNDPPGSQEAYAPEVTVSGTTVSVAPYSGKTSEKVVIMVLAQD